jgi:hypothetical protein
MIRDWAMKIKKRSDSRLVKMARRGDRGYPIGTVAFYGPDDTRASKVAVGVMVAEEAEPILRRWFVEEGDIRHNSAVEHEILEHLKANGVMTVVMTRDVFGCPHEEGIDYPDGDVCPQCPFWAHRDRYARAVALAKRSLE